MSKYFLEIKNRIILMLITCISTILISYIYKETILFLIVQPSTYTNMGKHLSFFYFIFTNVTEIFTIYLELIKFLSIQILFIYTVYHCFVFLSPALFQTEYLYIKFIIKVLGLIWLSSTVLATYFLIPSTWNFFLSFQDVASSYSFNLHFEAKLNEYLYFYISLYYLCEFYCQFFVVLLMFLNYINVNLKTIKKFRKLFYYFFIIFSTLISPPEVISQIFLSLTVIFAYELLLLLFLLRTHFN